MSINVTAAQLEMIKQQMSEANQQSHFVIFKTIEKKTGRIQRLITDHSSYEMIRRDHDEMELVIERDIVPITDALARWAVAENMAATNGEQAQVGRDLEDCMNAVLVENKLPANGPASY
ncbi:hypothetical protein [Levilactobacillus bambusae]|uniref:Uncharacterized protein n=1 Tax=Levilactobacillus bambusae TaxID=2024736 RepID=A0A2V1MZZ5_9LACO|nr:hypothetical protein [Levilactobacillus bambusae]PWG00557.1 hypothetical protein DCM90_06445 [Levilactobacillus bambusae]